MAQVQGVNVGEASSSNNGPQIALTSLYVGDLEFTVDEMQLFDLFSKAGEVLSVRVCRDLATRRSLGYAYVNFIYAHDAAKALDLLNFTPINGRPIRVMYSNPDASVRRSGAGNIFVKNFDKSFDHKKFFDTFSVFGSILSCKLATDPHGHPKGYGFVQFDTDEAAKKAIEKLNGMVMNGKQLHVAPFIRKEERDSQNVKFSNVFVKNFADTVSDDEFKRIFGEFGPVTSAMIMRDMGGRSKGFGFVNFVNKDDAVRAVDALNGRRIHDKVWYVGRALNKKEREIELRQEALQKLQRSNLYLKNIDSSLGEDELKQLFSHFGHVKSCKVMRFSDGMSKGSGFVAFASPREATKAIKEMNGKLIAGKPVYVEFAWKKEPKRGNRQAKFYEMPPMPMYPPTGPTIGQPVFYNQALPAMNFIPPQARFGYQQQQHQPRFGMRHVGQPVHNYFLPMVPQRQPPPRPLGGPFMQYQHQMVPRDGGAPSSSMSSGDVPLDMVVGASAAGPHSAVSIRYLTNALENATPKQ
ncbi:Polyadenylate-binding protein 2 [Linum perenne]